MRLCIVHVGMPKTGSTALQAALMRARAGLSEAGILVPEPVAAGDREGERPHSHRAVLHAFDGRAGLADRARILDDLAAALADPRHHTAILTYEGFVQAPPQRAVPAELAKFLAERGFAMRPVCFVRDTLAHLNSYYCHEISWLRTADRFPVYLAGALTTGRLDPTRLIPPWIAAAGAGSAVVPFTDATLADGIVASFLRAAGLDAGLAGTIKAAVRRNERPGPLTVEVLRRLASRGGKLRFGQRTREAVRHVTARAAELGWDETGFQGGSPALAALVRERLGAGRDRFAEEIWKKPWEEVFAPPDDVVANEVEPSRLAPESREEIERLVAETLRTVPGSRIAGLADRVARAAKRRKAAE
jgi:hypothetical protein